MPSVKRDGSAVSSTLAHGGQVEVEGEDVCEDSGIVPGRVVPEVPGRHVSEVRRLPQPCAHWPEDHRRSAVGVGRRTVPFAHMCTPTKKKQMTGMEASNCSRPGLTSEKVQAAPSWLALAKFAVLSLFLSFPHCPHASRATRLESCKGGRGVQGYLQRRKGGLGTLRCERQNEKGRVVSPMSPAHEGEVDPGYWGKKRGGGGGF